MDRTIVALLYDFDRTLCTQDMQNYAFIPSLGMAPGDFWAEANAFGRRGAHGRDSGLHVHHDPQEPGRWGFP